MVIYQVSYTHPNRQYIDFQASFPNGGESHMDLQLPAWRPGRYELGNFAKLIRSWKAFDEHGQELAHEKITKDLWRVASNSAQSVTIRYDFYAAVLNAGSTWLHEDQLYINPVNCFFYLPDNQSIPYRIELDLPDDYDIACGLSQPEKHVLLAEDVQQLMDCPLIASNSLQRWTYRVEEVDYHIWIQGEVHLNIERFINDHRLFTESQIEAFGSIPCEEYHFLYLFPAFRARHGVEHQNSTVIAMGPSETLADENVYRELIGISCHELYHTWNIKNIRPKEMMPYDFSKENYSRLGYVAEGVTTYYGDQYLHRCGVFDDVEYFNRLATTIERHLHNPARFNLSVAESSFDTWLDGYEPGVPGRKVSIYNEGSLTALITDLWILNSTSGERSLDDVMNIMYTEFGQKGIGYSEAEYREVCNRVSGDPVDPIFNGLMYGTEDYIPWLERCLAFVGLKIAEGRNPDCLARECGIVADAKGKVLAIYPDSSADQKGVTLGDVIKSINGQNLEEVDRKNLEKIDLIGVLRHGAELDFHFSERGDWYPKIKVELDPEMSESQSELYACWWRKLRMAVENFESGGKST